MNSFDICMFRCFWAVMSNDSNNYYFKGLFGEKIYFVKKQ